MNRTLIEDRRWLLSLFGAATLTPVLVFAAALAGALTWAGVRAGGIGATFDHRIIDGSHAAVMVAAIRRTIEEPWTLEPALDVQNRSPSFAS